TLHDTAAWQPVANALKLDHTEFERRVVAALPRIVRQDLELTTAERIAQVLRALNVDARILPGDSRLAYIEREPANCGPLPYSSLGEFIQPGESFRLHGSTTWQPWPASAEQESMTMIAPDDIDDQTSAPVPPDPSLDVRTIQHPQDEVGEAVPDKTRTGADDAPEEMASEPLPAEATDDFSASTHDALLEGTEDEPHGATLQPMGGPTTAQREETTAPPEDGEASEDAAASPRDDDLISVSDETTPSASADASPAATPQGTAAKPPARWRTGRVVVLLVLIALAIWAYRHWMADTRIEGAPATPVLTLPANTAAGKPATPSRITPGDNATTAAAPASAVTAETSAVAPAATGAVPAPASTSTPAATTPSLATPLSAPVPAGTTAIPLARSMTPVSATSSAAGSSGTLPANVGTVVLAQLARTASTPAAQQATPAH
ncbi:MAG: hypothetical protein ABI128_11310, partial [Rhodanobacter sp.]